MYHADLYHLREVGEDSFRREGLPELGADQSMALLISIVQRSHEYQLSTALFFALGINTCNLSANRS